LQQFVPENAYEERFKHMKSFTVEELHRLAAVFKGSVAEILIRA